jgi:competence protein ComEC
MGIVFIALTKFRDSDRALLVRGTVVCFAIACGIFWTILSEEPASPLLNGLVGERVVMRGVVIGEPDTRETNVRLLVRIDKIERAGLPQIASERVLIFTDLFPEYRYGDEILIRGILERPQNRAQVAGEEQFDWVAYLAKDRIYHQMFRPEIEILSHDGGNALILSLYRIKNSFLDNLKRIIPEPESALAGSLIVGGKQSLGKDLLADFQTTGVIHIVVLSGFNLSVVAYGIMKLLERLPRSVGFLGGVLGITLFALMAGAGAATVRAAIMALIVVLARGLGRRFDATMALVVAGFAMLIYQPSLLVYDTGFQLSFLATAGLIYISPLIEERLRWVPRWRYLDMRGLTSATIAAQIAVLPWLLYKIGTLSLLALPVNLLVLPFVPAAMLFGFLAGALGWVFTLVAVPFGWIVYAILFYMISVVQFFADIPFAAVVIHKFPLWVAILLYALIVGVCLGAWRPLNMSDEMETVDQTESDVKDPKSLVA